MCGDTTWAYATHFGRPLIVTAAAVITLPAVANLQGDIWIVNGAPNGTLLTISPNASDKFLWDMAGAAGADNKDIINTAATARKGDYAKIRYGSGDGWLISEVVVLGLTKHNQNFKTNTRKALRGLFSLSYICYMKKFLFFANSTSDCSQGLFRKN